MKVTDDTVAAEAGWAYGVTPNVLDDGTSWNCVGTHPQTTHYSQASETVLVA